MEKIQKMKQKFLAIICMILVSMTFASALTVKSVSTTPSEVAPGDTFDMSMKLENNFDYDIQNVNVQLDLSSVPFAPYQSGSEKSFDEISSDDEVTFDTMLIALPSAQIGVYKIPVNIDYDHDIGNITVHSKEDGLISVAINSKPELKVSLEDPVTVIKGQENTISVKVVNSGLSDVNFVYVSLSDFGSTQVISENEQYIGEIKSNDFDSVKYSIFVAKEAQDNINIPVTLKYKDATNKEFTESKTINFRAYSLEEAQSVGLVKKTNYTIYIIIILLIAGYFIRKYFKKRKLKKKIL